jgi:4-hydroxy-tetrahydrodipicolinate synthase
MEGNFGRVITAMVTPFTNKGSLDYNAAKKLAEYLVDNGSDGIVVSGTTGESPTLTVREKLKLFETVKESVAERAKVIAGTGNYCTEESIELTKEAEKVGVDASMLVVPYYNKPPQSGLYEHFKKIAQSTSLPIILYNVPSRTACNLSAETVISLSQIDNIVAIKEASGNFGQISGIVQKTDTSFYVYSGQDEWTLPMLSLGCYGVISVASHIVGPKLQEMIKAYESGQKEKALEIHLQLLPLFKVLFITTNPIMIKAAVNLIGLNVGKPRLPLVEANREQVGRLRTVMKELNLI